MEIHSGAEIPPGALLCVGAGGHLKEAVALWEIHVGTESCQDPVEREAQSGAVLLERLVSCRVPMLEQPVPEGFCTMERTPTGAVNAHGKES